MKQWIWKTAIFALVLLAFAAFLFTYQVRFTEAAVVTTFGKAGPDSVRAEPGLGFRLPSPFQSVTKYDTRTRVFVTRKITQQTADDRQIVLEAFCAWRVVDPLKVYQNFSNAGPRPDDHLDEAEETLRKTLRAAMAETSKYRMDELFSNTDSGSKLPELEAAMLALMRGRAAPGTSEQAETVGTLAGSGIEALQVGISQVSLPEATTSKVFDRMRATRQRLASEAISQGESVAETIRSSADADAERIRAFADRRALEIRALGEREAAQYLAQMNDEPDLAVFLKSLDLLKEVYFKQATLVLPNFPPGSQMLSANALDGLGTDELPVIPIAGEPEFNTDRGSGGR